MIYDIRDYGAEPNTQKVCTQSIQRAIDACGRGDTVLVPEGTFVMWREGRKTGGERRCE